MAEETPSGSNHNAASSPSRQRLGLLSLVWRFFAAPQLLMSLLGIVALALLLGTVIPQVPPEAMDDPETWLAMQSGSWSQMSGLASTVGLLDLFRSPAFRLLLALTGLTLFVWLVDSASLAWRAAGWRPRQRPSWPPSAFGYWGRNALELHADSPESLMDTESQTAEYLVQQGFRVSKVEGQLMPNLVAHRRAPALWAWPVFHGALLVALAGLGIGAVWGWRTPDWQLEPGDVQAVGHRTPYLLRLDAFGLQREGEGQQVDYRSHVTWLDDGAEIDRGILVSRRPLGFGGTVVRQSGYAPVVRMRGRDSSGHPLALQVGGEEPDGSGQVAVTFPTPSTQQFVLVGDDGQFVVLSFEPSSATDRPSLHIDLLDDNGADRQLLAVLNESGTAQLGDMQLELDLDYRPTLYVERRPGLGLVVGGAVLAVLALALAWLLSPQLLWIALGPYEEGTRVHVMALPPERGVRWPRQLTTHLQGVFDDGA